MRTPLLVLGVLGCTAIAIGLLAIAGTSSSPTSKHAAEARHAAPPPVRHASRPKAKPKPKPAATFTLVAGGDVALAGDPDVGLLAGVRRFLRGDVVLANLEGTLATGGDARCVASAKAGCFVFRASPEWAGTLARNGFTVLNVANNHALDFGPGAQAQTLAALRRAHIASDGLPGRITYVRTGSVKVAVIGTAPYRWAQSLLDVTGTQSLVRRAARHADVVVVYMHAGAEGSAAVHVTGGEEVYRGEPRGNPRAFAHAMIAAGADLVLASGPHVLRGVEWYRGRLIAYSLGNLATSHMLSTAGVLADSALLRLTLDSRGRLLRGRLVPLLLDAWGRPSFDPERRGVALVRMLSDEDFGAHAAAFGRSGALVLPQG